MTLTLNPGFLLIAAALWVFAAPRGLRAPGMLCAILAAIALPFAPPFGDYNAFAQLGLTVVPLRLDAQSQVFGLLFGLAAALLALAGMDEDRRMEDAALMALAGGALMAVYSGDLITLVAGLEIAAFGAAGIVFAAGGEAAGRAGRQMLVWQALSGALLVSGVGALLAAEGGVRFERIGADGLGGWLILAGLLIRVGAPLAHVAITAGLSAASVRGGAALAAIGALLPVYALMRGYPGEPLVLGVGVVMALAPLLVIAAQDDLRAAAGYGVLVWIGVLLVAIGTGAPLAISGATVGAFGGALGLLTVLLALSVAVRIAGGETRLSQLGGLAKKLPVTAALGGVGALSLLGLPGLIGHAGNSALRDALMRVGDWATLAALLAAFAAPALHLGLRAPARVFLGSPATAIGPGGAQFGEIVALAIAAFLCLAIGCAPGWLYGLTPPTPLTHNPFAWESVLPQLQLLAAVTTIVFTAAAWTGAHPRAGNPRTRDLDQFYAVSGRVLERGVLGAQRALSAGARTLEGALTSFAAAAWRRAQHQIDQPLTSDAAAHGLALLIIVAVIVVFYGVALGGI